jgi:hypothetical protein
MPNPPATHAPPAPLSIPELRHYIAKELRRGKSQDDLVRYLGTRGWPEVTARPFVANAAKSVQSLPDAQPEQKPQREAAPRSLAEAYKHRMIRGLLWMLAGAGLSFVAYDIASYYQSTGFVFIFAMGFGLVDFVLGLWGWLQHRK